MPSVPFQRRQRLADVEESVTRQSPDANGRPVNRVAVEVVSMRRFGQRHGVVHVSRSVRQRYGPVRLHQHHQLPGAHAPAAALLQLQSAAN